MSRPVKLLIPICAIAGLLVGSVIGIRTGKSLSNMIDQTNVVSCDAAPSDFSARQLKYADNEHARTAVLFEIRTLEQRQQLQQSSVTSGELGIAYARLGIVEEAAGNANEAHAAFDKARTFLPRTHPGQIATDVQIKKTVQRIDDALNNVGL